MPTMKELREGMNMTQEELGKKIQKSQEIVSQYETGARSPDIKTARKISQALNSKLDDIFFGTDISI